MNKVQYLQVADDGANQRLDNYLLKHLKKLPKSHLYKIIRSGEVRVNKKRTKPDYRLQIGDNIRLPPIQLDKTKSSSPQFYSSSQLELIEAAIIYEDDDLIIINKPAGIPVHGGTEISFGIIDALRQLRPRASQLDLVHRLDKETSGCLVLAKKRAMLVHLHALFREGKVNKIYHALLANPWLGGEQLVKAGLKKNQLKSGERMVIVDNAQGKPASTWFKPLKRFKQAALMQINLGTGRTHQIRVHATYIRHPVLGDEKYGDKIANQWLRQLGCRRMCLHAQRMELILPSGIKASWEAEMDSAFESVLQALDHI